MEKILRDKLGSFIVDHIGVGLFRYDLGKDRFVFINTALKNILKFPSKSKLASIKIDRLFRNPEQARLFALNVQKQKTVKFYETQLRRLDRKYVWCAITVNLFQSKDSVYLEGIVEDITKHKEAEERLEFERNLLQGLLDNIPDAVYFKDRKNRLIRVNKFYAHGFGLKEKDIIGKTDFDFFPKAQAKSMFEDDNHVLTTGKPIIGKIERTFLPSGSWNQVITTKIPMYGKNGKIIGTMGITRDITAFSNLEEEKLQMTINAITALSKALEMKDPYTSGHANRVSLIAERIAKELSWDEKAVLGIKMAGQLHDIGKIAIPSEILSKSGKLSDLEYQIVQQHVQHCYDIMKDISYPFPLAETIYQHHERLDGTGYPRGLKRNKIIREARILAVCDVLEAMTWHRPYRESLGINFALRELKNGSDRKYDREIVKVAEKLIRKNRLQPFWVN